MNSTNDRVCCSHIIVIPSRPAYIQMRIFLVCMLICLGAISAVAEDGIPNENPLWAFTKTLYHEGIERTYHISLPQGFNKNKPSPLVLALHGGGGEGRKFDQTTQGTITAAAHQRGVVLVFPEGVNKHWSDGRTMGFKKGHTTMLGSYQRSLTPW